MALPETIIHMCIYMSWIMSPHNYYVQQNCTYTIANYRKKFSINVITTIANTQALVGRPSHNAIAHSIGI